MYKIHPSQLVFSLAIGIIVGVGILLSGFFADHFFYFLLIVSGGALLLSRWQHRTTIMVVFFLIGALSGYIRADITHTAARDTQLAGAAISSMKAKVISVPRQTEHSLLVEVETDDGLGILVRASKYDLISLHDKIEVTCVLEAPEVLDDFNYPAYLYTRGVIYICADGEYRIVPSQSSLLGALADFRADAERRIASLIRAPEAGLANGLLFGGDDHLSERVQEQFARTGMSHITAVSGYNITIITLVVMACGIYCGLWRWQAVTLSVLCILLFVAMIGFPASGVRAAIMGVMVLLVMLYGRVSSAWQSVVLACALMLLFNPLLLFYDVGFQLSFLAVCGIFAFLPLFNHYFAAAQKSVTLTDIIFVTMSAQIFVVPIIALHFDTFSTTSLLANMLILPIIPLTMFFVFMASVISLFSMTAAYPFALLAQILLSYELWVIDFFAERSWSVVSLGVIPDIMWIFYYAILVMILIYFYKKQTYDAID